MANTKVLPMNSLLALAYLAVVSVSGLGTSSREDNLPGGPVVIESKPHHQSSDAVNSVAASTSCTLEDVILNTVSLSDLASFLETLATSQETSVSKLLSDIHSILKKKGVVKQGILSEGSLNALSILQMCKNTVPSASDLQSRLDRPRMLPPLSGSRLQTFQFKPRESSSFAPELVPLAPVRMLGPPPGVRVVVATAIDGAQLPEVTVTLSPQMSLVEALRKADYKLQSEMNEPSQQKLIGLGLSEFLNCYVVRRVVNLENSASKAWKITVTDRSGRTVYNSHCLPSREQIVVKPLMVITLSYTDLPLVE